MQPIYFGSPTQNMTVGLIAVGHEVNQRAAKEFASVASSEVAFSFEGAPVASTLSPELQSELARHIREDAQSRSGDAQEIQLGSELYLAKTVNLSPEGGPIVSLTVLKSFDKATLFLGGMNHVLIGLGLFSVLAGSALVFWISHTYTKPLAGLVDGGRALGHGDFRYYLSTHCGGVDAEVSNVL